LKALLSSGILGALLGNMACMPVRGDAKEEAADTPPFLVNASKSTGLSSALNKMLSEGIGFIGEKNWDLAIAKFDAVLKRAPRAASAFANRGVCYLYIGDEDKGIADLTKAVKLDPDLREPTESSLGYALLSRGKARVDRGDATGARRDFAAATAIPLVRARALSELSYIELNQGSMQACLNRATEALEADPKLVEALMNRAVCLAAFNRHHEALLDLNRALELDGSNAGALISRAGVYKSLNQCKEAVADARAAVHLDPSLTEAAKATLEPCAKPKENHK